MTALLINDKKIKTKIKQVETKYNIIYSKWKQNTKTWVKIKYLI